MSIAADMFNDGFGDQRLDLRARAFVEAMSEQQSVVVRQLGSTRAEQVGYYRLLGNEKLVPEQIIEELTTGCVRYEGQEHVLLLSDTTEVNFQAHHRRIKPNTGLGRVGNNRDIGLFLHTTLAIESSTGRIVGYSDIQYWTRKHQGSTTHKDAHKKLPIEDKESYRWIESLDNSRERLTSVPMLTYVADAEADIYEEWARMPDTRTHLLIASRGDRCINEGSGKLQAYMAVQPVLGQQTISLEADRRKKHAQRKAIVEVRAARVHLLRPQRLKATNEPPMVAVTAILVTEIAETIPDGHHGINWMLLTTHEAKSFEQAQQLSGWFCRRWNIEQTFRLLKHQGFNLESSQLEHGMALIRLSLLSLAAALRVLLLLLARDGDESQQLDDLFNEPERSCLERINRSMTGSSRTSRNPEVEGSMRWALWIIARLGGWKALKSERPPGPITLFRGLQRFEQIYHGWQLAHDG